MIYLKYLNKHILYIDLKVRGLFFLKETLKKGNYMCKIDLKDAHFASCNMIMQQCQYLLGKLPVFIKELSKLTGCLVTTARAVLPARLQYWAMHRQQIIDLGTTGD